MTKLYNLLLSTDFDSLKNDSSTTGLVVIPGGDVIAAGATATYETTVSVGAPEAMLIVSVTNNVMYPNGDYAAVTNSLRFDRTGTVGGVDTAYSIILRYGHTGGNNVRLVASIFNNAAGSLTLSPTTDAFTFRIRSIKVPRFE